ncbi:MAG: hypothetical protein H0X34_09640 [Chthoniobacterales bacterium]|nr:hypothetical protein [Chthoniobacterales bacterium]
MPQAKSSTHIATLAIDGIRPQNEARRVAQYAVATLISGQGSLAETGPQMLETIGSSGPWVFGAFWIINDERQLVCHSTWRTSGRELEQFQADTETLTFSLAKDCLPV